MTLQPLQRFDRPSNFMHLIQFDKINTHILIAYPNKTNILIINKSKK